MSFESALFMGLSLTLVVGGFIFFLSLAMRKMQ